MLELMLMVVLSATGLALVVSTLAEALRRPRWLSARKHGDRLASSSAGQIPAYELTAEAVLNQGEGQAAGSSSRAHSTQMAVEQVGETYKVAVA